MKVKAYKLTLKSGKRVTLIVTNNETLSEAWAIAKGMAFRDEVVDIG